MYLWQITLNMSFKVAVVRRKCRYIYKIIFYTISHLSNPVFIKYKLINKLCNEINIHKYISTVIIKGVLEYPNKYLYQQTKVGIKLNLNKNAYSFLFNF
jgi:hypothetical protein